LLRLIGRGIGARRPYQASGPHQKETRNCLTGRPKTTVEEPQEKASVLKRGGREIQKNTREPGEHHWTIRNKTWGQNRELKKKRTEGGGFKKKKSRRGPKGGHQGFRGGRQGTGGKRKTRAADGKNDLGGGKRKAKKKEQEAKA